MGRIEIKEPSSNKHALFQQNIAWLKQFYKYWLNYNKLFYFMKLKKNAIEQEEKEIFYHGRLKLVLYL